MKKSFWRIILLLGIIPLSLAFIPYWVITGELLPDKYFNFFVKKGIISI